MANFNQAYKIMLNLEFNDESNALHKNPTEQGLTFMGIYEKAHPKWQGWQIIKSELSSQSIAVASKNLMKNKHLQDLVAKFYEANFWDKMRANEITSQDVANEIFIFGVNVGITNAIKTAQKVLNLKDDGVVALKTLDALNACDELKFNNDYDSLEMAYYERLIQKNPKLKIYAKGWKNRALSV